MCWLLAVALHTWIGSHSFSKEGGKIWRIKMALKYLCWYHSRRCNITPWVVHYLFSSRHVVWHLSFWLRFSFFARWWAEGLKESLGVVAANPHRLEAQTPPLEEQIDTRLTRKNKLWWAKSAGSEFSQNGQKMAEYNISFLNNKSDTHTEEEIENA